ncbi:MAG: RdgB/HAM1 family non-canonical purine NTP pyrophosphatase [Clostridia bacterium]|nr:RdgB/HAM1 family non-canonical purine NTP pyrophosphatase [Clostridia bacterium]
MKKKIVVASGNHAKIKEIQAILSDFEISGYKEHGLDFEIEENGTTFYENALIKAKAVSDALGVPALADDSGLVVEALGGAPGIYSARYAGDGDDSHNNQLLLKNMQGEKNRNAKFVCCMVYYSPDGSIITATGETHGKIMESEQGPNGFGYDPLFFSDDLQMSLGVADPKEKNKISHRFRALEGIRKQLK